MTVNILVLAAGHVGFDINDGGYPLCLTEMDGVSLIERIVDNTKRIKGAKYSFALREDDVERYHLDRVVELLTPGASMIRISNGTKGSACTALLAASHLNLNHELLIISANELVDIDLAKIVANFRSRKVDGGALIFQSVHPRYSFVRLNREGLVSEAAQQNPISHNATTGVFWFARTGEFVEAVKNMLRKDAHVNGNFYVCPAFNEMLLKQAKVGVEPLDPKHYFPLKTERQLYHFESGGQL